MPRRLSLLVRVSLATLLAGALAAPVGAAPPFPVTIALPTGFQPEGISSGPGTRYFVGSLADGRIWSGDLRTGEGDVLAGPVGRSSVGTEYEPGADRLWVAGGAGPTSDVRVYDATSGALLRTYPVSPAGFLNDVAVTHDAVYVTDSGSDPQHLVVIPLGPGGTLPGPGAVTTLDVDIPFEVGFNANGIVAVRGWLLVVQSNTGVLWRVDPDSGDALAVDLGGYDVTNGDGLFVHGSTLYVVRNQDEVVAAFRLGPDLTSATLLGEITAPDLLDVPTTVTVAAGRLWAVNARFGNPDPANAEYWVTRLSRLP